MPTASGTVIIIHIVFTTELLPVEIYYTYMIPFFTPLTIIIATIAGFSVGFLWYSPFLFRKMWMKGQGIAEGKLPKRTIYESALIQIYSFIAHGAIASVIAIMLELLSITSLTVAIALSLLLAFGLIVTTRFIDMIYAPREKYYDTQSQIIFLVGSGYYLASIAVMTVVIFMCTVR